MQCRCPKCQGIFEAEQEWVGRQVECPFCRQVVPVQPIINPQMTPPPPPESPVMVTPVIVNQSSGAIAGIGARFLAVFIDGIIMGVVNFIIGFVIGLVFLGIGGVLKIDGQVIGLLTQLIGWFIGTVIGLAYEVLFISMKGATPGKMAMHIKVQYNGQNLTFGRSLGRFFAKWLSSIICMIGYIMAFFNPEHKALHDQLCDTLVVEE